jgi:hypothetical protein
MTASLPLNDETSFLSKDTISFPVREGNLLIQQLSERQPDVWWDTFSHTLPDRAE